MPTIYLIRHAQASFGRSDYDRLSRPGEQQAAVLGEALAERGLEAVPRRQGRDASSRADGRDRAAGSGPRRAGRGRRRTQRVRPRPGDRRVQARLQAPRRAARRSRPVRAPGAGVSGDVHRRHPAMGRRRRRLHRSPSPPSANARKPQYAVLPNRLGKGETALVFTSGGPIAAVASRLLVRWRRPVAQAQPGHHQHRDHQGRVGAQRPDPGQLQRARPSRRHRTALLSDRAT